MLHVFVLIINYISLAYGMSNLPKLLNKNKKTIFILNLLYIALEICAIIIYSELIIHNDLKRWINIVFIIIPNIYIYYETVYDRLYMSNSLSLFSIYEGVNKIDDGIMFSRNGHVIYANEAFDNLISAIFNHKIKSADYLFEKLNEVKADDIKFKNFLCVRVDDKIYAFKRSIIYQKNDVFVEINSMDVTEEIMVINELKETFEKLNETNDALNEYINNVDILEREKQKNYVMNKIHNSLSYRISILNRDIISKSKYETSIYESLKNLNKEFTDTNKLLESKIELLNEDLKMIGAQVLVSGFCPYSLSADELLYEIIREATTNAIYHGNADKIYITFFSNKLEITNNGEIDYNFKKGKGITLLEKRCEERGWSINIEPDLRFKITVNYGEKL